MAEIIQFPRGRDETEEEFHRRMDFIGRLWMPLRRAIQEMHDLGADGPQVVRMLRAAMELVEEDEAKAAEARETDE
jgi:hypothetical protein